MITLGTRERMVRKRRNNKINVRKRRRYMEINEGFERVSEVKIAL